MISGGNGDDLISGDKGVDTVSGGAGADRFAFDGGQATISGSSADVVQDYLHGTDHIQLGFAPSAVLTGGNQSSFAAAETAAQGLFNGHAGDHEVAVVQVGADSYLFWAADAGGTVDSAAQLQGVTASLIGMSDFI
jgi:Ca2+-binding RTX toxin-like protein